MTIKVVLFNGPPRCGKDTIAKFLLNSYPDNFIQIRMAETLKRGCHALLGLPVDLEHYDEIKDKHVSNDNGDFFHLSPREFYIKVSEELMKPTFGNNIFGLLWLRIYDILHEYDPYIYGNPIATIADSGFAEETQPLIDYFGEEALLIIRIHREGCDYSFDSRSYIRGLIQQELDVENPEGNVSSFYKRVTNILSHYHVI